MLHKLSLVRRREREAGGFHVSGTLPGWITWHIKRRYAMRRNLKSTTTVAGYFVKLAVGMLALLVLSLATGCVGPQRVANLEGQVEVLKAGLGQTTATANEAAMAAKVAPGTANQAKADAAQANLVATEAHNIAGRAQTGLHGIQTVSQEHATTLAEYREFREKTVAPLIKRVDDHRKRFRTLQGDEPTAPDTSALVAGPGAPAPKAITKQEGPVTFSNPSAAQIKRAIEEEGRDQREVRLYGLTDATRQSLYDSFRHIAKAGGLDPNITIRALNAARAGIEVDFGPIPDTVKALRTAPKPQ
jgi:hypothetical protein